MARIVVLGAGLVGSVMAEDLSLQHEVTSVDISKDNLDKLLGIETNPCTRSIAAACRVWSC